MKLLITGAWSYTEEQIEIIRNMGHEVIVLQNERDMLPCPYSDVEGVICNGLFLYHPIEKFTSLRYVQLTSAGFDRVPMDYVNQHGIEIRNARGVYSIPMAEYAVCGVLELYKQSRFFYDKQKNHEWIKHRGIVELSDKTVCIIGCGSVGTECAKRFSAFSARVIGVDLFPTTNENYERIYPLSEIDTCLSEADVVVLTLPLTDETKNIMNRPRFDKMKRGSLIVNIARGAVIDTEALISALASGRLFGAVLDVFESEPLSAESPLWDIENVIITPHNSFVGDKNAERLWNVIKNNLEKI